MSASFVSVGWTLDSAVDNSDLTREDVRILVERHSYDLMSDLDVWDYDEFFDDPEDRDAVVDIVSDGLFILADPYDCAESPIADTGYVHYSMGGTSYGDEPFDGYTNACIALVAVEHIPELGKPFGVIGGGVRLPDNWGPIAMA